MFKKILSKSGYITLLGVLNVSAGLVLTAILVNFHNGSIVMELATLTFLNLLLGINNFFYGLRTLKHAPIVVHAEVGAELSN